MDTQRWRLVWDLFDRCVEAPEEDRTALIDRECDGDGELAAAVRRMLEADGAGGYTEPPPPCEITAALATGPASGDRIGIWRLERLIGAGGMGSVYLAARADEEFEQRVALKLIKRGMDTDDILTRFKNERQVLAQLEHPGIAHLIDGGSTDDGRPYIVMEYVEGVPIDQYCDGRRLGVRERIELCRAVCDAVHSAHKSQVVHRDLKPSNILVTEDGAPKLLDFGIAKVIDPTSFALTVDATATGMRLMTPDYASPEQIRGDAITTASDVYSLGVVLYRLLTGRSPYRVTTRLRGDFERVVCELDPPRPSVIVSRNAGPVEETEERPPERIASERGMDTRRLRAQLSGDLDTIVMMALRKEPERRYASVNELSLDLERYLLGYPVTARPDTWRYRSTKFLRRNRLAVGAGALVILALSLGVVVSSSMYLRSERRRIEGLERQYTAEISAATLALKAFDVTQARRHLERAPESLRGWEWWHLAARLDRSSRTVEGNDSVTSLDLSPDGRWAVSGWGADALTLWDTDDWSEVRRWSTDSNIQSVAVADDGSRVAAAVFARRFIVWDSDSEAPLQSWRRPGGRGVARVAFDSSGEKLAVGDVNGIVRLLACKTGEELAQFSTGGAGIACLSITDGDSRLLAATSDSVHSCDMRSGDATRLFGFPDRATSAAYHAGKGLVAMGAADGTVYVWRTDGNPLSEIRAHDVGAEALAFSLDGAHLASGASDRTIRIWDVTSGERLATLLGHEDDVTAIEFLPAGRALLSGSRDGTLKLWEEGVDDVPSFYGNGGWFTTAIVAPDGERLVTVGPHSRGALTVFDLETRAIVWASPVSESRDTAFCAAVSADGRTIATGSQGGIIELWDADTWARLWTLEQPREGRGEETIRGIAFSPDGDRLAATARSGYVTVRSTHDGELAFVLRGEVGSLVDDVCYAPDGTRILTVDTAGTICSWDASTGELVTSVTQSLEYFTDVACSSDSRLVATAASDGSVRLYDAESLEQLHELRGHSSRAFCVAFSPDSRRLVSGSEDTTLKVWDPTTGRQLATLYGHSARIDSVAFSPDGRSVVSKSTDGEIRIWDSLAP